MWDGGCSGAALLTLLAKPDFQWNPQHHQLPISKCWIYTLKHEPRANPWANKTWRKRAAFKLGIHLSNIYNLDISNIQIAGWASLNLVWKQTPSAVCLLACLGFFYLLLTTSPIIPAIVHTAAKALKMPPYLVHPPVGLFCFFHIFNKQLSPLSFYCLVIYSAAITKQQWEANERY